MRRDPFDDPTPIPWPLAAAQAVSLWDPIPVGRDEQGEEVTVRLATEGQGGLNMLIGGIPGSGKSVAQSIWVAAAALDPHTRLWIMDGKQLDTAIWAPCAHRIVGPNGDEAIHLLLELHHEMELRRRDLLAREDGAEKIAPGMGLPLHFLLIDELAAYLRLPDA
ncbi:MAG: FtsK/SpoIIIE domain-containing protein, partial [Patescibacteria group bacterium]